MVYFKGCWWPAKAVMAGEKCGPEAVIENYGDDIKNYADEFHLDSRYLAALCMMESGGRKPVPFRFEKHVYTRLKLTQIHLRDSYEHVKADHISDAGDEALQNLASSWGPFQLMGYKCLMFGIKVKDLRGDNGVYWASKWIDSAYGKYIRKGEFKNAFHIHNAGTPFPKSGKSKTYDPAYVDKGLKWMKYFEQKGFKGKKKIEK